MTKDELLTRTKEFAHRSVKLTLSLPVNTLGRHLQNQLIRSSTSVAANYRAACLAQFTKVFISKLSIVVEECDESLFWMEFILDEKIIPEIKMKDIVQEAKELTSIFISSRKTVSLNSK